jgi:hypothetical protein
MNGKIKGIIAAATLAAAAACSGAGSPTESSFAAPDQAAVQARTGGQLVFTSQQSYDTETPQSSSGGLASISFAGSLTTGQPCYVVTGAHRTSGSSVTVTVTATRTGDICTQVVTHNNYDGKVVGLTAGTYTFTVVHQVGTNQSTAHTNTVVVQ